MLARTRTIIACTAAVGLAASIAAPALAATGPAPSSLAALPTVYQDKTVNQTAGLANKTSTTFGGWVFGSTTPRA